MTSERYRFSPQCCLPVFVVLFPLHRCTSSMLLQTACFPCSYESHSSNHQEFREEGCLPDSSGISNKDYPCSLMLLLNICSVTGDLLWITMAECHCEGCLLCSSGQVSIGFGSLAALGLPLGPLGLFPSVPCSDGDLASAHASHSTLSCSGPWLCAPCSRAAARSCGASSVQATFSCFNLLECQESEYPEAWA